MINIFKYFSYGQMTVIAALTVWFVVQCVLNGGQFHLYLVIFIMMSLFGNSQQNFRKARFFNLIFSNSSVSDGGFCGNWCPSRGARGSGGCPDASRRDDRVERLSDVSPRTG